MTPLEVVKLPPQLPILECMGFMQKGYLQSYSPQLSSSRPSVQCLMLSQSSVELMQVGCPRPQLKFPIGQVQLSTYFI